MKSIGLKIKNISAAFESHFLDEYIILFSNFLKLGYSNKIKSGRLLIKKLYLKIFLFSYSNAHFINISILLICEYNIIFDNSNLLKQKKCLLKKKLMEIFFYQ